jgi:uncharacterized protein (TIRG00374 family)
MGEHDPAGDETTREQHPSTHPRPTPAGPRRRVLSGATLRLATGIIVSVAAVLVVLRFADLTETLAIVATADPRLVLAGFVLFSVLMYCRAARWQLLLPGPGSVRVGGLFSALFQGYAVNTVLPFRAGDLLRVVLAAQRARLPKVTVLTSVLVEQALDLAILVVLLALQSLTLPTVAGLPFGITPATILEIGGVGLLAAALTLGGVVIARHRLIAWYLRTPYAARIHTQVVAIVTGLSAIRGRHRLWWLAVWTVAVWLSSAATVQVALAAMGIAVDPAMTLFVLVMTNLGLAIPSAPGNVGVYHAAAVGALLVFGVSQERALAAAILMHAVSVGAMLFGGAAMSVWDRASARLAQRAAIPEALSTGG